MAGVNLPEVLALVWLLLLLVVVPVVGFLQRRRVRGEPGAAPSARTPSRTALYAAVLVNFAVMLGITLALDGLGGWSVARRALIWPSLGWAWVALCVFVHQVTSVATMAVRRWRGLQLDPGTGRLLPRGRGEYRAFVPVAIGAGVCEEYLYRGFVPVHLVHWGMMPLAAMALSTLAFGVAHGYKSAAGMARATWLGAVVAVPVVVTGSLLPSIVAHALSDLLAGALVLPLARRFGVRYAGDGATAI